MTEDTVLTEDEIRRAAETIIGENSNVSKYIAWSMNIPNIINTCIYENFMRPRNSSKKYCSAVCVIKKAACNLEEYGTWRGKI